MPRPVHAIISVPALRRNLARARALAPRSKTWAVVKANAYGHGLENALEAFADADGLALIEFDRAQQLRRAGWRKPLLMLEGAFDFEDTALAVREGLTLVVHEPRQIDWLARLPADRQLSDRGVSDLRVPDSGVPVCLKFNSGMNRLGFDATAIPGAWARLASLPAVGAITLASHFANSDLAGGADEAIARFDTATAELPGERSLANSAAVLAVPASHRDWIRPGIMLYGASPFGDRSAADCELQPAMRLRSRLIAIQQLAPGDAVGYGSRFVAERPTRIGVVACGYADGYPRHAPNGTPIAVAGVRTGTVGRVAMDMLMVDLSPVPEARIGAEVELWGDRIPIDEVAQASGTIGYELMCALAPRVPVRVERQAEVPGQED